MENKSLNTKYSLINGFYYMLQCAMIGYASVFLLDKDVKNTTIGIILASANIIAVICQSFIASYIDKTKKLDQKTFLAIMLSSIIVLSLLVLLMRDMPKLLIGTIIVIYSIQLMMMPFINSLVFVFEKRGISLNYGLARGLGSGTYAIMSLSLGYFVNRFSPSLLPYFYASISLITLIVVLTLTIPKIEEKVDKKVDKKEDEQISIKDFLKKYKSLNLIFVGTILLIFDQTLINNFFVQVVTNVGGNVETMGTALFIQAMVELPTMFLFVKLQKKFGNKDLMIVAAIFFSIKHVLIYLSGSMTMLYFSMITQTLSNALFVPAAVYYVGRKVEEKDLNKGQALIASSMTIGNVFAALCGGVLFDVLPVSKVLLLGTIVSIFGTIIMVYRVLKDKKEDSLLEVALNKIEVN